jgi:hypothetical protein
MASRGPRDLVAPACRSASRGLEPPVRSRRTLPASANFLPFLIPRKFGNLRFGKFDLMSHGRDDWEVLLAAADSGGVGVIGALRPEDELARSILGERRVNFDLHFGIGNWMGCYHWIPAEEMFEGLPAGGLAGEAYADVLPHYVMSELGGRVYAGSFRNTQTRREAPAMIWYSDIEVIPFGSGKLVFCQYRLFNRAASNPLAGRVLGNLLRLARTLATPA